MLQQLIASPCIVRNPDFQTIYPAVFRKTKPVTGDLHILKTWDNDSLQILHRRSSENGKKNRRVVILSHGLEGSMDGPYIQGMTHQLLKQDWDVVLWNFRGCGEHKNSRLYSYHSGKAEDLAAVVLFVKNSLQYESISLVGFSAGGNLTLKFLGEYSYSISKLINRAIAISCPANLEDCARRMAHARNVIYMQRFLKGLKLKMRNKKVRYPSALSLKGIHKQRTFMDFDEVFTAPQNGFRSPSEYWGFASCLSCLKHIKTPSLLISSKDDPLLGDSCYPTEEQHSSSVLTQYTERGGHLGYVNNPNDHENGFWHEHAVIEWLANESTLLPPPELI